MSAETLALPAAEESTSAAGSRRTQIKALADRLSEWGKVALLVTGRSLAMLWTVVRIGFCWKAWAEGTGIARREAVHKRRWTTTEDGKRRRETYTVHKLRGVPKLKRWEVSQHSAVLWVKVPVGADLSTFAPAMPALRHAGKVQSAKVREHARKPGVVAIDVLRRDPLGKVALVPRALGPDRFVVAVDEHGHRAVADLAQVPHWLFAGATNGGKSSWVNALASAMATRDDCMVMADLKWGLEAQALGPRWSRIATTKAQCDELATLLLDICENRAAILGGLMCQNLGQLEERYGVHLRRLRVFVDEVAELGGADEVLDKLASLVSRVRSLGVNVMIAGQRFGADQGKKVTTIRGQLTGRVVTRVNDFETAKMALPGADDEVRARLLSLDRPGMALVHTGGAISLQRPAYRALPVLRRIGEAYAHHAIALDHLAQEDSDRTAHLSASLDPIGA